MASTPKQVNGNASLNNNGPLGKRKKSRNNRSSYLSKWLDKTMHQVQDTIPSLDPTYDPFGSSMNWAMSGAQFAPGYDPCRYNMYGCTPEPMSLPTLPTYFNPLMPAHYNPECRYGLSENKSVQVQRARRRRSENKAEEVPGTPANNTSCTLSHINYLQPKNFTDSQDFASLPPIVTSMGDTNSNSDVRTQDKDDASNARRFSDPCVRGLPDIARPANGDIDSETDTNSDLSGSQVGSRLLSCLLDQISSLKMVNERLNKDLQETRAELDNVRQQNVFLQKSSSGLGGTPNHSPLNSNGLIGGQYSPGFLTDLVREIRDAARMREEAMYSRIRAMVIERTDNGLASSEAKLADRTLEEIKSSLRASEADKHRMMDRIIKLEDELRTLRMTNGMDSTDTRMMNGNMEDPETERLRLRKEIAEIKKAKQQADDHALKLERLVTQLRSKFNGLQITANGPDSLPSDAEHDTSGRARRTSVNSTNNSTVVFGPVTDL
ncbi:uncharacterized protein [Epargyreus clarus]|uniref:uncharacterized protein isoform X2 n=1 Tax=Epargyreus clarus TaxID=520877 RepID=UPI003C2DAAC5